MRINGSLNRVEKGSFNLWGNCGQHKKTNNKKTKKQQQIAFMKRNLLTFAPHIRKTHCE